MHKVSTQLFVDESTRDEVNLMIGAAVDDHTDDVKVVLSKRDTEF